MQLAFLLHSACTWYALILRRHSQIDFDGYFQKQSSSRPNTVNPTWPDKFSFEYETKFASQLKRKVLQIKVYDKNSWTSDTFIGRCKIDLRSLCTGPVANVLELRDGDFVHGRISFMARIVHVTRVELQALRLGVQGIDPSQQLRVDYGLRLSGAVAITAIPRTSLPSGVIASDSMRVWREWLMMKRTEAGDSPPGALDELEVVVWLHDPRGRKDLSLCRVPLRDLAVGKAGEGGRDDGKRLKRYCVLMEA